MKKFLLASSALLLVTAPVASAQEKTLTISVYGFAQDAFKELVYTPFEQKCGCKLVVETGNSVERLAKMEANKASPVVDMAVVSMADALSATRADLIEKIDTSKLQNFNKLYDLAKDPNGDGMSVGYTFYATSIVYRSDKMEVNSWADLLSDKNASHVAFPNVTTNQGPPALYMVGEAIGKNTPDLKEAIAAVGAKKDDIVTFYVKSSQLRSADAAGRNLGRSDRSLLLGRFHQARPADQVGNAQGRPDRRHERHGADQGQQEPGSGA